MAWEMVSKLHKGWTMTTRLPTEGYFIGVDAFTTGKLDIRRISDPVARRVFHRASRDRADCVTIPQAHRADTLGKKLDAVSEVGLFAAAIHKNKVTGSNTLCTAHNIEVDTTALPGRRRRNGSRGIEIGEMTNSPS